MNPRPVTYVVTPEHDGRNEIRWAVHYTHPHGGYPCVQIFRTLERAEAFVVARENRPAPA